jgi:hypothetical protein
MFIIPLSPAASRPSVYERIKVVLVIAIPLLYTDFAGENGPHPIPVRQIVKQSGRKQPASEEITFRESY